MLSLWAAAWAGCALDVPPETAFAVPKVEAADVGLGVEVWARPDNLEWAKEMLEVFHSRSLSTVVVVPLGPPPDDVGALLAASVEKGHDVGVWLEQGAVPIDALAKSAELRQGVRAVAAVAGKRVRTVVAPIDARVTEALLQKVGLRSLVNSAGPPISGVRIAATFETQQPNAVVLHSGPYEGECGHSPITGQITPAALDRSSMALTLAPTMSRAPYVRLVLDGRMQAESDAEVLGRWLDTVVLPGGTVLRTPEDGRLHALAVSKKPAEPEDSRPATATRWVPVEALEEAAAAILVAGEVPRSLPSNLNATEAYLGFLEVVLGNQADGAVRLGAMAGPATLGTSQLEGRFYVERDALDQLAQAIASERARRVPSLLPLGGKLLTASEVLVLLASAVAGEERLSTRPMGVPEPHAPGLGWGDASPP